MSRYANPFRIGANPLLAGAVLDRAEVVFMFKQIGGPTSKSGGRELDGRTWDEFTVEMEHST